MTGSSLLRLWAVLALLPAARVGADPEGEASPEVKEATAEGALDARPAPAGDAASKGEAAAPPARARPPAELPSSAGPSAWRAGARAPAEVPAAVVVRTAAKKAARPKGGKGAGQAQGGEDACTVEIIWHAPGWTP